jgi:hypothetical protein
MNLVTQAEADLSFTLEDKDNGFGVAITLIDELANSYEVNAQTTDVGFFIDPTTGEGVAGRQVTITVRISTLSDLGGGYPTKQWTALYTDTNGNAWTLKVQQNRPDRKLGVYNIIMEAFKP